MALNGVYHMGWGAGFHMMWHMCWAIMAILVQPCNYDLIQKIKSWSLAECTQNLILTPKSYMCMCVCVYACLEALWLVLLSNVVALSV